MIHIGFITLVCCRDTLWIVEQGFTVFGRRAKQPATIGESSNSVAPGQSLRVENSLRQVLDLYLHSAGIESGYGFFAPNVGNSPKLILELQFADGGVEYEPIVADSKENSLRLASFMDYVNRTNSETLRDILIRSLAKPFWQRRPEIVRIRAILGVLSFPSAADLLAGKGPSYEVVSVRDLARPESPHPPASR